MRAGFLYQPPKSEAENLRLFFERFGGYTAFIKAALNQNGYKQLPTLADVAKRTSLQNDLDTKEFEGTISDGIE